MHVDAICISMRSRLGIYLHNALFEALQMTISNTLKSNLQAKLLLNVNIVMPFAGRWSEEFGIICCRGGQVQLPILLDPPQPLRSLLSEEPAEAGHFRKNGRKYSSALTMASMEANVDLRLASGPMAGGPHQRWISGTIHHRMGPLIPYTNQKARFAHVHIMETEDPLRAWHGLAFAQSLREPLLMGLGNMLKAHSAYAKVFRQSASLRDPDETIVPC